jgi:hypothetical protein
MSRAEVQAFFDAYARAFTAGDGDAVAALWHTPAFITDTRDGHARVTCWGEREPMRANMAALCDAYAQAGAHHWHGDLREHTPMGAHHAFALVDWTMHRPDGAVLQRFRTGYQLARLPEGVKVIACTAFDENLQDFRASTHAAS